MKVYQLMVLLEKAPAGAEVVVNMVGTLDASVEDAFMNGDSFQISGGDAEVVDETGETIDWLSNLAEGKKED